MTTLHLIAIHIVGTVAAVGVMAWSIMEATDLYYEIKYEWFN